VLALVVAGPAHAHDYWLTASPFHAQPGEEITVRLFVGEGLTPEAERPFRQKETRRLQVFNDRDARDLTPLAVEEQTPLVRLSSRRSGGHVIALDRDSRLITLEADKFNAYLAEEGLEAILAQRRRLGEADRPGRERYSRYLKCLVQVGDLRDDTATKVFGQKLELVPLVDPATLRRGDTLRLRVLFEGKPLAGVRVFAEGRDEKWAFLRSVLTNPDGLAEFRLEASGMWLVRLVHMRRAAGDAETDWESFWGALTFAIRG
jgi:uncharacterized GH25 family protein